VNGIVVVECSLHARPCRTFQYWNPNNHIHIVTVLIRVCCYLICVAIRRRQDINWSVLNVMICDIQIYIDTDVVGICVSCPDRLNHWLNICFIVIVIVIGVGLWFQNLRKRGRDENIFETNTAS
jgi:hypothetical protein